MPKVILVVDDEESVRFMLRRFLGAQGYHIVEADSAAAGWAQFNDCCPDLVMTDLKMPGEDGLWLAQKIIDHDPNVPVLLITAYADLDSARRAVSVGIYEYYIKPIDLHHILSGVQRALEFRRLAKENRSYQEDLEQKVELRTQELERVYEELIHTEKLSEVGRLAAGVVHEVLNPLSVVMGRIDLVMMDPSLGEKPKQSLEISREQLRRAVKIMDNLRRFSKQNKPEREILDVNALLRQTFDLLAFETQEKNIAVNQNLGDVPPLMADRDQLAQVFLNFIKNALDAMPNGGTLTVETTLGEGRGGVDIVFTDTGEGIPNDIQERVFDVFFTTKKTGTGLGLGICRGIVEAHGGTLTLNSLPKKGTTFILTLPILTSGKPAAVNS